MPFEPCLENGDYVLTDAGALKRAVDAHDELLRRVLLRLKARRGGFVLAPEFGSRLHLVPREKPSARVGAALRYAAEALADEPLTVVAASLADAADGSLELTLTLELDGGSTESVTLTL